MSSFNKFLLAASFLVLAACDSDDDLPPVPTTTVQILHASPDAPAVDVFVDGAHATDGSGPADRAAQLTDSATLPSTASGGYQQSQGGWRPQHQWESQKPWQAQGERAAHVDGPSATMA